MTVLIKGNILVIPDTQIPFEAKDALTFAKAVQKEFRVPPENVYHAGDETDQYFGSTYKKDPNAWYTPDSELQASREKLLKWYAAFPQMKLAVSNHMLRWAKKAWEAEIPNQVLKPYRELIEAPEGWVWKDEWIVNLKNPFRLIHGMGYSGQNGHVNAALDSGMSTVIGHLHGHAAITVIRRPGIRCWAANAGCLIDETAFAFEYGRYVRNRPCNGVLVVIDGGLTPIWIPFERMYG